jgi:mRNA interferase MazF
MRRGEIWWADLPAPAGRRPVVLLSRDEAYAIRDFVTIAPLTTRVRKLPVEVPLGRKDGLPRSCVINADSITTVSKRCLSAPLAILKPEKVVQLESAVLFALGFPSSPPRSGS